MHLRIYCKLNIRAINLCMMRMMIIDDVYLCVRALKGNQLRLEIPKLVRI